MDFQQVAAEKLLRHLGQEVAPESELATPTLLMGYPKVSHLSTTGFCFFMLDVSLDIAGNIRLIEANGSNGAASSVATGTDELRVEHMAAAFRGRTAPAPNVALISYDRKTNFLAEIVVGRAGAFTNALCAADIQAHIRLYDERPGSEDTTVYFGPVEDIADHVSIQNGRLYFRERPVAFAGNPNLLPELVRRGMIPAAVDGDYAIDTAIFHEGAGVSIVHDKAMQQRLAEQTGIAPLKSATACNGEDLFRVIQEFHQQGLTVVAKMNAGSGGAGIEFFTPGMTEADVKHTIAKIPETARRKYGDHADQTLYPVRVFEFFESTKYKLSDGTEHLWDVRLMCLISPGRCAVLPCQVRLCPGAFDARRFNRDAVLSNTSGRKPSIEFQRSPFAAAETSARNVLESVGVDADVLARMTSAAVAWCQNAMTWIEAHTVRLGTRQ